ncbi:tRNA methyltransferase complex GCD14 subunit-domain-containing protein [Pseudomassariella vexata]|uniref:tRNA (adenine(58)-N(1))-methyltransferase catalytic subunit TRM61 n=1 Tax=Pseudomassariella vexata TaxID=1141098 RepID=A0A1Y2EHS2_9PEZI|nr:tRNA methyltransferase complex GCD14 subunit-domain-containing protein [Pseudomassariella vexata]ORY71118.1 tRNA methyltransferase complex GCD14 subunit-domain-containing protein [Pseudomassariella vexata]
MAKVSPFLDPGVHTAQNGLAIVHLSRDNLEPVILNGEVGAADGYAEGRVINTRFGSFPHSTLIDQPWGSQIRASVVDTGTRGRKRKPDEEETAGVGSAAATPKNVKTATSGFVHVLPPTPELWTTSLPHRTQVVYTPDYSYILHRIRARPGTRIIEAGAGSGSFTHASARAVYNGYFSDSNGHMAKESSTGKVFSYEFNEDRFHKMQQEVEDHGLSGVVEVTHRDVYNDGFFVNGQSPDVDCVFLDLPAPWKALPHLSRGPRSPLRKDRSVHLCTFSPCIEQVTQTVEVMRRLGWMDIEMVEVSHKRISVLRERVGLNMPTERGSNQSAYDVAEAVQRLREVEGRFKEFHGRSLKMDVVDDVDMEEEGDANVTENGVNGSNAEGTTKPPFMLGRLIHRTEPEIKTHTSYLVFAILPQEWTEEQEAAAFEKWPCGNENKVIGSIGKEARKQEKREMLQGKKKKRTKDDNEGASAGRDAKKPKLEDP